MLAAASPTIADVVTGSLSLNAVEPLMKPEMDLSGLSFHFEIVGTPRGALDVFATLSVGVLAFDAVVVAAGSDLASGVTPPPNPNNENVGLPLTGGTSTGVALALAADFFAFGWACCLILCTVNGDEAPLMRRVGFFSLTTGMSATLVSSFLGNKSPAAALIAASRACFALRSSSCCLSNSVTAGLSLRMYSLSAASVNT